MVLVDTSVWGDYLRVGNDQLALLLNDGDVLIHPFVIGELACGNLKNRTEVLLLLSNLPEAVSASHQEMMRFIDIHKLMGKGLGYVDAHLLAAAILSNAALWTLDKQLKGVAATMKAAYG